MKECHSLDANPAPISMQRIFSTRVRSIQSLDDLLWTVPSRDFMPYSLLSEVLLKTFSLVFWSPITSEVD